MKKIPAAWKPKNKKWMAKREQEWEKVKVRLPAIPGLNRDDWWDVEDHFFRGKPLPSGGAEFQFYEIIVRWWLHPGGLYPSEIGRDVASVRRAFRQLCTKLSIFVRNKGGDSDYGLMGGREQKIVLFLNRGWDPRELSEFSKGISSPCCSMPYELFQEWLYAMDKEIAGENYIAHSYGLVLFDYVIEMMEQMPQAAFMDIKDAVKQKGISVPYPHVMFPLRDIIPKILGFFDRDTDDTALQRPQTVAYVKRIVDGYSNKTLPKGLIDIIDLTLEQLEAEDRKRKERNARQRELRRLRAGKSTIKEVSKKKVSKKKVSKKKVSKKKVSKMELR